MEKKPTIGILGGVGSGKSVVSRAFGELGCVIIDADVIAHEVLALPEIAELVIGHFGPTVQDSGGGIDRSALGRMVFEDPDGLAYLNSLIHPKVLKKCQQLLADYGNDPAAAAMVLDMPLLVEVGWEKQCDFLVFVDCHEAKRLERAGKNGKIDPAQLKKREKCQISLDKKRQIAHYIVYNNSELSDVREQIARIFSSLTSSK
ncbi:MAG: dephospho-CoA kinase [Planctomycetota bacterium]|jgi:dephospho-CoA kinase